MDAAPERDPARAALAHDWLTIWQSELAAIAVDREVQEAWLTLLGVAPDAPFDAPGPEPAGAAGPDAPPRTAPADAASRGDGDALERLGAQLVDVERRLADLEGGDRPRSPAPEP